MTPSDEPEHEVTKRGRLSRARRLLRRLLGTRKTPADFGHAGTSMAILRAQQEATLDGILVVDLEGRVLSHNRRFREIWKIPDSVPSDADDFDLLSYSRMLVVDWAAFIGPVNHFYKHPREPRIDDVVELTDGRVLSRTSVPVISDEGQITGRAWYFRDQTKARKAEKQQAALFRIAEVTRSSRRLDDFYAAIHSIVQDLMGARNFYIAILDPERNVLTLPYFVDEVDAVSGPLDPNRGLTGYVMRTGKALLADRATVRAMVARGEVEDVGAPSIDWLGAPLRTGETTWGVLATQTYDESVRFGEQEKEVLQFVSQHVATAIEQRRVDDALRNSEQRYRQMFQNNRAVQLLLDPESGSIVDANVAAAEFYGYSIEQFRTMHIWDLNSMPRHQLQREMQKAATQLRSYFVFSHRLANGDIRDVEVHSGPIDVNGKRVLYSIIHDVTERRQAERALLRSEGKYRNIFNFAPVGIYQSTTDGKMLTANPALARILGYDSPEDLLKVTMRDVYFRSQDRDDSVKEFLQTGFAGDYQLQWRKKDGSLIWVQLSAHAIQSQEGDYLFEGFVFDITQRKEAETSLASANAQRKAVLDAATRVSIIATDASGLITVFNAGAERMLGYAAAEVIGKQTPLALHLPSELSEHAIHLSDVLGETVAGFDALIGWAAVHGADEGEWTYVTRSGEHRTVHLSVTALRAEDGSLTGFLHVANDVTERKLAEETLRRQTAAMTASMDGIAIVDENGTFTYVNDAMAKLFGFPSADALDGQQLSLLYDKTEFERFERTILPAVRQRGRWRGEANGLRPDGLVFPQEISFTAIDRGGMVCVVRDVTERTYAEEQIKHLAYHDALTGLPNRLLFKDRLTVALSHAQRGNERLAVLFLDLDRFKVINDSLGHTAGDQLLQAVAWRVQSCVRESDTVARLGGDEFTLLLPQLTHSEDAARVAQKILQAVQHPFPVEGRDLFITTSVGISLYPEDGEDAETLIKNADTAMYQAKAEGRDNYQLFNAFVNAKALLRISLEHGLRRALVNDELVVYYQPIFDLRSLRITGLEALLRWQHPELGLIPPNDFIPLAENTGMMPPIGLWVLRTACMQTKAWHDRGFNAISLAVNLSVTQLQQLDLVERVRQVLMETGLPPESLELEITESSAMQNPEHSARTLYELKKLGLRISLDDFGTGHSSLSYLKRFPIDTLKIDQSFVRDIISDPDTAAIVSAIIAMTHSLRLKVIAEGVEYAEQATLLKEYGCDQMQGYFVKAPVPAAELERLLLETGDQLISQSALPF
jgi:diguanylate cyclase (GGDEF)-like protein/PAS domain S-box-containing protein